MPRLCKAASTFRLDASDREVSSVRRHRLVLHRALGSFFFPTAPFHLREYRSSPTIANRRQSARPILSDLVDYVIQVNASAYPGPFRGRWRSHNLPPYKQVFLRRENISLMSNGCVENIYRSFLLLFWQLIITYIGFRIFWKQMTCARLSHPRI